MPDILFRPDRERLATTNAWAFLRRITPASEAPGQIGPAGWESLRRAIAADPAGATRAFAAFAAIPDAPARLALPRGAPAALVLLPREGPRQSFSGDALATRDAALPPAIAAALARPWSPEALLAQRADLLLHADLRPDDVVLLAGLPAIGWLPALGDGTRLIVAEGGPANLLGLAAATGATVLAAPAGWIAEAAFARRPRPDLAGLRIVLAEGGPMAPAARARVYAWIKADVMLLARAGARRWGNPLSPVVIQPKVELHVLAGAA
ncbi:MAG: hypothetical protein KGL52_02840 [Rhodospirillales bacterium]|nr:hypothetical protein [Rhodospirillales bacterium]